MNPIVSLCILIGFALVVGIGMGYSAGVQKGLVLAINYHAQKSFSRAPLLFALWGSAICFFIGAGFAIQSQQFLTHSVQTSGTVVEVKTDIDYAGDPSHWVVYEYRSDDGATHRDQAFIVDRDDYRPGERLPVRYLRESPQESRIDTFMRHWFAVAIAAAASLLLFCFGVAITWWNAREQKLANEKLASTSTPR